MITINIATDFTEYPGLRNCSISEFSGEEFYHSKLNSSFKETLDKNDKLLVNLDGTGGYASSFLDEAFGNLVYDFSLSTVKKHIDIISNQEPHWKDMIEKETFLQWEERRKKNDPPKVTADHKAWYRIVDNNIKLQVWEHPLAV